jgi:hypothetical protein
MKTREAPETYIGHVEGWRWWLLNDKSSLDPHPCSIAIPYRWKWAGENACCNEKIGNYFNPAEMRTVGAITQHTVAIDNKLGFYAYKQENLEVPRGWGEQPPFLFGSVALYGLLCRHQHGFRAEKARIIDVWCQPCMWYQLQVVPQVKGVFYLRTEEQCLELAMRKQLKSGIHSNCPTTISLPYRCQS